jgi:predicted molibdopterin-dependent oxidoreductase YjgC
MPVESSNLCTEGISRGKTVLVYMDGREVQAFEGDSVLGLLWANGEHDLHRTARTREARGFFCGIGVCFDCLVTIDGKRNVRACLERVKQGMRISRQQDAGYQR